MVESPHTTRTSQRTVAMVAAMTEGRSPVIAAAAGVTYRTSSLDPATSTRLARAGLV
ncbi:hypothetical protein ACTG9Q_28470 [Actinokineospora sp. 24-640]